MFLVFAIIAAAYACRMLAMFRIGGNHPSYIRAALYLLLFALWGFSLDQRITQKQVLHGLRLTALLMLVWLLLRTLKYEVVTDPAAARYIWYLYYLPMLFIPLLGVFIALSLGKPEEYRLSGKVGVLAVIPAVLFALVLTNDFHQLVFAFDSGIPGRPDNDSFAHRPLYFVCFAWMVACMFFSLIRLWKKSRVPGGSKRLVPFDDVPKGSYYESAVLWAVENGITNGTGAKTFSPNANCSRSQIVTFLWRSRNKPASGSSNPFTDVPANAFYTQAVLWAVDKGVTKGTGANTFSPNADCSRGQIVTFIHRAAVQ